MDVDRLREEIERTGVSIYAVLKGQRFTKPTGLSSIKVSAWLDGANANPKKEQLLYVLSLYEALPDNPWIELNDDLRARLLKKRQEIKGKFPKYYRQNPPPTDVSLGGLSQMFHGKMKRIRKLHLDYLLNINI